MLNPPSAKRNETHKLLWDFDIQTDHLISTRRSDLIIINNNNSIVDFDVPANHRVKLKESKKKDKYLDLARELKELWNMKVMIIPIVIGALGTVTEGIGKNMMSGDYPNNYIIEIGQNTEEDPGDLRRLAVNHELTLAWKNRKSYFADKICL